MTQNKPQQCDRIAIGFPRVDVKQVFTYVMLIEHINGHYTSQCMFSILSNPL